MSRPTFIITGGTGFLGSGIAVALLQQGQQVVLPVRPGGNKTPRQRIRNLLRWYDIRPGKRLQVVEAYLDRPGLGLSPAVSKGLRKNCRILIHCAADTSFGERHRETVRKINLTGLENVFTTLAEGTHFFYMSTAYTAGTFGGRCLETLHRPPGFTNHYEETKNQAESLITRWCDSRRIPLTILRPSIVYGDSVTGRSLRFNALYFPIRFLLQLKTSLMEDILRGNGRRAEKLGVSIDEDHHLVMPLRVADRGGGMDLIPVDHLVKVAILLIETRRTGIFHIVNPRPKSLSRIVAYINQYSGIRGIRTSPTHISAPKPPLEKFVSRVLSPYDPYFCDQRRFDDHNTRPLLASAGISVPDLDYARFCRCMDYARSVDWGGRLPV